MTLTKTPSSNDGLYKKLISEMGDGFALHEAVFDENGKLHDYRFFEVNRSFEQITGLKSADIVGRTVRDVFTNSAVFLMKLFEKVDSTGTPLKFERYASLLGRHLEISAYQPAPGFLACVVVDISDRKRIEKQLSYQEQQYRLLAENANALILRWRTDGIVTYINDFGEKLFGFSREELIGRNVVGTIVSPTETSGRDLAAMITEIARHPERFRNNDNENTTSDGRKLWMRWNNSGIFDAAGNLVEIISLGYDQTEYKRVEEALRESEATFRAHVDNSFDVIFTLDAAGTFIFVSPAWERHFGYPASQIIGQSFAPTVHPDDIQPCVEYLTRILQTGQSGTSPVYRVKCADGSLRSFVANGMPYVDTKGQLLFIGVGHDISDQLQAEQERLDLERQLLHTQKLESLGVLAGGIAHDFNNLLQAIQGNLELASMELATDSAAVSHIGLAVHAARRAADLTNRMLAYSGKGQFVIKELDLNDLVIDNAAMLRAAVLRTVSMDLATDTELSAISGDEAQIQQVIMNLITNAAEAIEEQPGNIKLTTGVQYYDQLSLTFSRLAEKPEPGLFVYLEVADNGIGMSDETKARIFDPFFTTKFIGRGLGMSSVLGIIKGHGGAIFVESAPGKGTTIRVCFPALGPETAVSKKGPPISNFERVAAAVDAPMSGLALVVDDEKAVLKILSTMVRLCGFRVITAGDGIEAVNKYREHADEIDLVLMDLTMPNMDGATAMNELRLIKPDSKVILSSGFNEVELDCYATEQSPSGFIRKPYSLNSLERELRRVMLGSS